MIVAETSSSSNADKQHITTLKYLHIFQATVSIRLKWLLFNHITLVDQADRNSFYGINGQTEWLHHHDCVFWK
jgi:hypothetical protein